MDEAYIGSIVLFAGNFAPRGWAFCDGSLLAMNQYQALYAILGTTYGGNGTQTFALPDLRSRVPVHANNGQAGPGQPAVQLGQSAGSANVTLTTAQMPMHTHVQQFANVPSTTNSPASNVLAQITAADADGIPLTASGYAPATSALVTGASQAISQAGGSQPVNVMPPYLGLNYIICLQGLFPTRD
jgi:microcystin-dependent protein